MRRASFHYAGLKNKRSQSRSGIKPLNVLIALEDWVRYQRLYPAVAEVKNQEFMLMLSIFEAVHTTCYSSADNPNGSSANKTNVSIENINLQDMAQQRAKKTNLKWQAPKPPVEQQLRLPHATCC